MSDTIPRRRGRRFQRAVITLCVLFVVVCVVLWATARRIVVAEDADRVRPGMSRADVDKVIGRPPDEFFDVNNTFPIGLRPKPGELGSPERPCMVAHWYSPEGHVHVYFVNDHVHHAKGKAIRQHLAYRIAARFGIDRTFGSGLQTN